MNNSIIGEQQTIHNSTIVDPRKILQKQNSQSPSVNKEINNWVDDLPRQKYTIIDQMHESADVSSTKTKLINKKNKDALKPINQQKHYKTKMCQYGVQCKKQFVCHYAHNQHQLKKPFKNRKNQCVRYQKGLCHMGSACSDHHGNIQLKKNYKYKSEICEDFLKGKCLKGQLCIKIHENPKSQWIQTDNKRENETYQAPKTIQNSQQIEKQQNDIKIQDEIIQKAPDKQEIDQQDKINKKGTQIIQIIEQKINGNEQLIDQGFNIQINF